MYAQEPLVISRRSWIQREI